MRAQAAKLTAEERKQIAEFLGAREAGATPKSARCSSDRWDPEGAPSWNGWGAGPENARFAAAAGNGLTASNVARLKLKWAFALGSVTSVRSQAAVFGGRVFIGASTGSVWAIDAATGCVYWEFAAGTAIGSSTTIGSGNGRPSRVHSR